MSSIATTNSFHRPEVGNVPRPVLSSPSVWRKVCLLLVMGIIGGGVGAAVTAALHTHCWVIITATCAGAVTFTLIALIVQSWYNRNTRKQDEPAIPTVAEAVGLIPVGDPLLPPNSPYSPRKSTRSSSSIVAPRGLATLPTSVALEPRYPPRRDPTSVRISQTVNLQSGLFRDSENSGQELSAPTPVNAAAGGVKPPFIIKLEAAFESVGRFTGAVCNGVIRVADVVRAVTVERPKPRAVAAPVAKDSASASLSSSTLQPSPAAASVQRPFATSPSAVEISGNSNRYENIFSSVASSSGINWIDLDFQF